MRERWSIAMHKEDFKFSCAHFLIFPDGSKERLHGHNYQVSCEIEGALDAHGLVIDFNQAKPVVRSLCRELNERWLVPGEHPLLQVLPDDDGHTRIIFGERRYCAPSDEIRVMPMNNVSVENLAAYLGRRLRDELERRFGAARIGSIVMSVTENSGQGGVYRLDAEADACS